MPKNSSYYRRLPYKRAVELRQDTDGRVYFLARIDEIPSIRIHGDTREEALLRLDEIFDDLIESMIDEGTPIPEPELWPTSTGMVAEAPQRRSVRKVVMARLVKTDAEHVYAPEGARPPRNEQVDPLGSSTLAVA